MTSRHCYQVYESAGKIMSPCGKSNNKSDSSYSFLPIVFFFSPCPFSLDIRLESQGSGSDPRPSSSPSSPPSLRPRALSFGSPSSLATAYKDIASRALTHALAEVSKNNHGCLAAVEPTETGCLWWKKAPCQILFIDWSMREVWN